MPWDEFNPDLDDRRTPEKHSGPVTGRNPAGRMPPRLPGTWWTSTPVWPGNEPCWPEPDGPVVPDARQDPGASEPSRASRVNSYNHRWSVDAKGFSTRTPA